MVVDYSTVTELAGDEITQEQLERLCHRYYWAGSYCAGKEVLEAFAILSQKHKNLELVIRSDISPRLRERYQECLALPNLRLINRVLPFSELEQIYQSADIFII